MKWILVAMGLLWASGSVRGEVRGEAINNWPQWRGPEATGVAPNGDPPVHWSETENVAWKVEIPGAGNGSPVVWGERLYVLTAIASRPAPQPQRMPDPEGREPHRAVSPADHYYQFVILALDRATGEVAWRKVLREEQPHDGTHQDASYASNSPVTDGEHIFAYFGSRGLYALDTTGDVVWEKDLGDMSVRRGFGEGSSPALYGDKLIVLWDHQGQSFIVALDKATGQELWRVDRDEITSWTTPLVVELGSGAQVVTSATQRVRSYELETGRLVWSSDGVTLNAIPSPVARDGVVYIMSGFRGAVLQAVRLQDARGDITDSDALLWSRDRDTPYVPSPLLYGDSLYFLKSNSGILSCLDAKTGESRYLERLPGVTNVYASPVGAGNRVYVVDRGGTTAVLEHGPELEVLATNTLDDGFDASPAIAGKELYLRGRKYLYRLSEENSGSGR